MTVFRDWAAAMCGVAVGCALLSMLCPQGTMRRVFSVLTAVLFLCCLLSPVTALIGFAPSLFSLPEQTDVSTQLTEEVDKQLQDILEQTLLQDAVERVEDAVTVHKVAVCRDNTRTDSIYIERVRVTLSREDRAAAASVRTALEQAWGVPVEVYYVG